MPCKEEYCKFTQITAEAAPSQIIVTFVYQTGDLVKQPMKSRDVLPKNVPGVGWVGWVIQRWGGVCHAGVGWVIQGGVGYVM